MRISATLPTGVAALLFDSARRRRRLEAAMVERLESAGFSEAVLPVLDYLEPYEGLPGPVRRADLYSFVDRDGEVLALRADFTPLLARLLASRMGALTLPLRLFYRGDVLRYEEERAGRERELYQLGAEVLGADGAAAEEEALGLFLDLLGRGERRRLLVVLGFAGALDEVLRDAAGEGAAELAAAVVRRERRPAAAASEVLRQVVADGLPADPAALGRPAADALERLLGLAVRLGAAHPDIELRVDLAEFADHVALPELRRRMPQRAYYDGLVFRAYAAAGALPIGGGGRYDRLFRRLGADVTAAGFSLGVDRLAAPETPAPEPFS